MTLENYIDNLFQIWLLCCDQLYPWDGADHDKHDPTAGHVRAPLYQAAQGLQGHKILEVVAGIHINNQHKSIFFNITSISRSIFLALKERFDGQTSKIEYAFFILNYDIDINEYRICSALWSAQSKRSPPCSSCCSCFSAFLRSWVPNFLAANFWRENFLMSWSSAKRAWTLTHFSIGT